MIKDTISETADHQILAMILGFVADRLMALDVDQLSGQPPHGARSASDCLRQYNECSSPLYCATATHQRRHSRSN